MKKLGQVHSVVVGLDLELCFGRDGDLLMTSRDKGAVELLKVACLDLFPACPVGIDLGGCQDRGLSNRFAWRTVASFSARFERRECSAFLAEARFWPFRGLE